MLILKVQSIFTLMQFTTLLKDTSGFKVFDTNDISFATDSPIQITNDKEFDTRSTEVWSSNEIEKI